MGRPRGRGAAGCLRPRKSMANIDTRERLMPSAPEHGPRPAWPTEVRLRKDKAALRVTFETGEAFEFPAEFLRVLSPSAEVQGHSPEERKTVPGKRNVTIIEVHPVGNYAVRLVFDDLHSTGIFSWDYFLKLGRGQDRLWRDYLDDLASKGMSRDPPKRG
jgi:DUF971 family protein